MTMIAPLVLRISVTDRCPLRCVYCRPYKQERARTRDRLRAEDIVRFVRVAQAAAGNTRRALQALEQAAVHGFRDMGRVEQEPLLAKARKDPHYQGVLEKMRP